MLIVISKICHFNNLFKNLCLCFGSDSTRLGLVSVVTFIYIEPKPKPLSNPNKVPVLLKPSHTPTQLPLHLSVKKKKKASSEYNPAANLFS